jgi:hypothetical protein
MFRNIGEIVVMIFIAILVYSLFILLSLILVKTTGGTIQLFIESPIVFIFYLSILLAICYAINSIFFKQKTKDS